jgi:hypothetical protein
VSSIRENIVQDVKTALLMIHSGAGYHNDVGQVDEWAEAGTAAETPLFSIMEGRETVTELAYPKLQRTLPIDVYVFKRVPTTVADKPAVEMRMLIADVERAVLQDSARAGNAIDTRPTYNEPLSVGGDAIHLMLGFEIIYHTNREDPDARV